MNIPTMLLVPMVSLVLLFAAVLVARMVRGLVSDAAGRVAVEDADRIALEDRKARALENLVDLEFEHEMGKIDDSDFAYMQRSAQDRALALMGELDKLGDEDEGAAQ